VKSVGLELTAVSGQPKKAGYVAFQTSETGTASQGESIDEALANLREATSFVISGVSTRFDGHHTGTMFQSIPAPF